MMKTLSSPIDLIKKSINIFSKKENAVFLAKVYVPVALVLALSILQTQIWPSGIKSANPWIVTSFVIMQIVWFFVSTFFDGAAILAVRRVVGGGEFSFKEVFLGTKKRFWKYLLVSLFYSLMVGFGLILLIVPGIYLGTIFAFVTFIIMEENTGIKASYKKSAALVKGSFWKITGRLVVIGLVVVVANIALGVLPFGLGTLVGCLLGGLFLLPTYLLYKEISG